MASLAKNLRKEVIYLLNITGNLLPKIVLILYLINVVSCAIVRLYHGGEFIINDQTPETSNKAWLVAGLQNQPKTAYRYISIEGYEKAYMEYSYLGFCPKAAARQIEDIVKTNDIVCGVSVGAKPIEYTENLGTIRVILINPCSHPKALRPEFYYLTRCLSPLAEVISYALGWIAVIPIIPADIGVRTSIALLVDELFWIGWGDPQSDLTDYGVVVSTEDEFLMQESLYQIYDCADFVEIKTKHDRTGSNSNGDAEKYEHAISSLLY